MKKVIAGLLRLVRKPTPVDTSKYNPEYRRPLTPQEGQYNPESRFPTRERRLDSFIDRNS